jgi:ribosomal protein S27AE
MTTQVRIIGPSAHAMRLLPWLHTQATITGPHRTRHGCVRHGTTVLAALVTRWTCASCGTDFAGPLCPNCNSVEVGE